MAGPAEEELGKWEQKVQEAVEQDGGLTRNSMPEAIAAARDAYDQFLARYPLLFGYWHRFAKQEFAVAGTEAAELVYERGVANIPTSVDLWTNYCGFKIDTSHDPDVIRELFERGVECVGLDFLAHPLWDKYIEFEERSDAHDRIFMILSRVIHIPLHQYARYFERYRVLAKSRPLTETAPMEIITKYRDEVLRESGPKQKNERELEQELRNKINAFHMEVFQRTQTETTKRWTYESEVKRPYYHVTELDEGQLSNWRRYLDFEQAEGSYVRTKFLYERCVVTAADYEEFWLRYARWMMAQEGKEEEVRNIYQRASCVFVPISQPAVRSYYAQFEESQGRPEVAIAVYEAILMHMPSHTESIISLANVHRRQHGLQVAIDLLKTYVEHPECTIITRGTLVSEWARLAWRVSGKSDDARKVYESNKKQYSDCGPFWIAWLKFELQLPTSEAGEPACYKRIKSVFDQIRQSRLPPDVVQDLAGRYFAYLAERGGKDAMVEYMQLDKEISGPKVAEPVVEVQPEVAQTGKKKRKGNVNTAQANQHHHNQQGQAQAVNGR